VKIKSNKRKKCWAERERDNSNLHDFIENKAVKKEKGSNIDKKEESGVK